MQKYGLRCIEIYFDAAATLQTDTPKMYRLPLVRGKKGKPRKPAQVTTQIVSHKEPPSI